MNKDKRRRKKKKKKKKKKKELKNTFPQVANPSLNRNPESQSVIFAITLSTAWRSVPHVPNFIAGTSPSFSLISSTVFQKGKVEKEEKKGFRVSANTIHSNLERKKGFILTVLHCWESLSSKQSLRKKQL